MSAATYATEIAAAALFLIAVAHTFSTRFFARLAHTSPRHAGLWHLLSEVEVVFGFWAFVLISVLFLTTGRERAIGYLNDRNFTEPMFVFVIMVIAASRPVLAAVRETVRAVAASLPVARPVGTYFLCVAMVPLLGSFITEPAAMTLSAILLRDAFYARGISTRLKYATIGVLFVNISIGGTLTPYAAPPVLMVAAKWGWDLPFMLATFGWKAAVAVLVNGVALTWLFREEIALRGRVVDDRSGAVPPAVIAVHLTFLAAVVAFAHHPEVFMGLFLFFLGYVEAYKKHQDRLILREGLLVAFFLAGLVTLGGLQQWWLQPALSGVEPGALYWVATVLTAITDNAALTYLGSLVEGTSAEFKYALVAGAVTGGGLTVIANAPNPAGFSILKGYFPDESISPTALFVAALAPTAVAAAAFLLL
ncbi:MAG: putative Na+/H+ antiporter [Burkholderiales bacterium]|nr:putative Na+/H+ antiporter [Burkholderiales bacterium]